MAREAGKLAGVMIIYAMAAVVMTWPVITDMGGQIAGSGGDAWQTLWRFEDKSRILNEAWKDGRLGDYLSYEFGGRGEARLVNHSVWPWMWLYLLAGSAATYNIIWLLSYILGGGAVYLLVKELVKGWSEDKLLAEEKLTTRGWITNDGAAILAGFYFMMLPYHEAHSLGHFGAMQIQWIPLAIYAFIRWWRATGAGSSMMLGLAVTVQAWSEHHYALWLLMVALIAAVMYWRELFLGMKQKNKLLWAAALTIWLAVSIIIPYWPTMKLAGQGDNLALGQEQTVRFSADAVAWFVPAPFHTAWGNLANNLASHYFTGNTQETTMYLGVSLLLLVIFFRQAVPEKQRRFWCAAAIIFGVISLGPRLHVLGKIYSFPLPYAVVDSWPIFSAVRAVARAGIVSGLAVAVLFGWVVKTQVKRVMNMVLLAVIITLEFMMWPVPRLDTALPEAYGVVRDLSGETLIEIPAATNYALASRALYGSLKHGKKILGGIALERAEDPTAYKEVRSLPALRQILFLKTEHLQQGIGEFMRQEMAETLADTATWVQAEVILIHPDSLNENQIHALEKSLEGDIGLRKEIIGDTWLYRLDTLPAGDGIFASRDERWLVQRDTAGTETATGQEEATLWIYNGNIEAQRVEVSWDEKEEANRIEIIAGETVSDFSSAEGRRAIRINLLPGKNEIIFRKTGKFEIYNPIFSAL